MCPRERFFEKVRASAEGKNSHLYIFEKAEFDFLVKEVEEAIAATKKTALQYRRVKRFNIVQVGEVKKLVTRGDPVKYFLPLEEIFDVIDAAHVAAGHGGRDRLKAETARKYANVTTGMINIFLSLCETCQKKKKLGTKGLVSKPILHTEFSSRCQIDLIDMQSQPDVQFRFILNYQDHLTKFVQLRALQSKRADEVASNVLDIFLIFGAPILLHSDNGREFVDCVIDELQVLWPELKIVHGKPRHSQSQGSGERANQDVERMLASWMLDNKTTKWSHGLKFVQFMKNRAYHAGIKMSPYKAMFGVDPKVGLATAHLPVEVIGTLNEEEDLQKLQPPLEQEESHEEGDHDEDADGVSSMEEAVCKARWGNMRDNYRKSLKKTKTIRKGKIVKKYKYSEQLNFLRKFVDETIPKNDETTNEGYNDDDTISLGNEIKTEDNMTEDENQDVMAPQITPPYKSNERKSIDFSAPRPKPIQSAYASNTGDDSIMRFIDYGSGETMGSYPPSQQHPVDAFLSGLAPVLKQLSPHQWHYAKSDLFSVVQKYELKMLKEQQQFNEAPPLVSTYSSTPSPAETQ